MRLWPALVVLALLVTPGAVSTTNDDPHVLVRIDNAGPELRVRVVVEAATDTLHDGEHVLAARGRTEIRVPAPAGEYRVAIERGADSATPLAGRASSSSGVATAGCPGAYAVDFALSEHVTSTAGSGCLSLTLRGEEILAEARRAGSARGLARVEIPAPGLADRGAYDGHAFEWRGATRFPDAWARPVEGSEVAYASGLAGGVSTSRPISSSSARVDDPIEILRFAPWAHEPIAWSRTLPALGSEAGPTQTSVVVARELNFGGSRPILSCVLKSAAQGRTLQVGDVLSADEVCPAWGGPAWRAGERVVEQGARAIPLYQVEESPERTLAARVVFADGMPYPLRVERFLLQADRPLRTWDLTLTGYEPGGQRAPALGAAPPAPVPPLAPLDPLRGPALGEAGARVPFPLHEASDAARSDPTLRDLQLLLARPDAALVFAEFGIARDDTTGATTHRWTLVFSAEGADAVAVACERPGMSAPVALPARCVFRTDALGLDDGTPRASIGRDALPARAPTFAAALARWDAYRAPERETMSFATYCAWEGCGASRLAVGVGAPATLGPIPVDRTVEADHVALTLADGSTLSRVELVQRSSGIRAPLAFAPAASLAAGGEGWGGVSGLPLAVGLGALAIAALVGFVLYSRLVRTRVLDDATRARILDVVAAQPGLHASAIREAVGKQGGVGEYHLGVLAREGFLTTLATPGFTRYFVTGRHAPREMRAIAALREGQNEKLMRIIRERPGIELRMLAVEAGVSVPYVSRSVARLAEAGLVEKVHSGRSVAVHPAEG